jgi:uncharacterized caspase-like protein
VSLYRNQALNLRCASTDAQALSAALTAAANDGTAYQPGAGEALLDKDATRERLLQAIDAVRKSGPKPSDLFVLSFAGHVAREGGEFYLLTHEADPDKLSESALSGTALREKLADFPCQALVLLDAGHAAPAGRPTGMDVAARALSDVDVRVAVMCAALGHEAIKKEEEGLFTAAVVRGLRHSPDVFFNRQTGTLNVYHLQAFVYQEVVTASKNHQTPFLRMPLAQPAFTLTQFPITKKTEGPRRLDPR